MELSKSQHADTTVILISKPFEVRVSFRLRRSRYSRAVFKLVKGKPFAVFGQ